MELDDFNLNNQGYRIRNFQNDEQTIISETNELVNLENFNVVYPEITVTSHFSAADLQTIINIVGTDGTLIVYFESRFEEWIVQNGSLTLHI